ncbi:uncharacterized protein PGRI_069120 [Penicillium griseofulvum]|uniref:Uncharacterized protein n=1 Tax=Penicillium patulum TaxID=5078 RepID=A0A135LN80_PENPA|nr:uncharacterized protein PGRI_069120 [Penicillium griseofulvum]KXG50421.1 hypothetical protein PGRI_069120 [Penicillium griseofulvum]
MATLITPATYRTLLQNRVLLPRIVPSYISAIERLAESAAGQYRSEGTEDNCHFWYSAIASFQRDVTRMAFDATSSNDIVRHGEISRVVDRFPVDILPAEPR